MTRPTPASGWLRVGATIVALATFAEGHGMWNGVSL